MSEVVVIVQARMGSTRLPGKVLLDIVGAPMLARVLARAARAPSVDRVLVATTTEARDDVLAAWCAREGWACFRGSEEDVLDRYHRAAQTAGADVVVRVTSDCPLLSPVVLEQVVQRFLGGDADYASNALEPRTFPRGLDVEVFSAAALERAWREDRDPRWREHVTPYFYRSGRFRLARVANAVDHSAHRWTVDTPEDLALARTIYGHFGHDRFEWTEALRAVEAHPAWSELNRGVMQKGVP